MESPQLNILIYSPQFYPRLGGVERVTQMLAQAWGEAGYIVKVVCQTEQQLEAEKSENFAFEIVRFPSNRQLVQLLHWCDVYVQSCISLKGLVPWLLVSCPLVMIHHTWYCDPNVGNVRWQDGLKLQVTRLGQNIAVSEAIASHLPSTAQVIENPYDEAIFYLRPEVKRDRDLVFVGRLVSDKGVDLLIEAIAQLQPQGLKPKLTLIGSGPERSALEQQIQALNLTQQVTFAGELTPTEVAQRLCQHKILVVPSRWREPFGIVALEGIACGCWVVGSNQGGLSAAIGPGGLTFENGNVEQLATRLRQLLTASTPWQPSTQAIAQHLNHHQQAIVAQQYLAALQQALR